MTKSNVSRTRKPAPKGVFPKRAEPANDAAKPEKHEPELPFTDGSVNERAPLMTLVAAMFEAPDLPASFQDPGAAFMANMLLCLADETELVQAAGQETTLDRSQPIDRFMYRLDNRARIAVEIARRIQAGEVTS